MSNHLGQIYSTTKNAEKYIVLNSQNVELSGNVKLTNGNLDVSQNLKFNNFSVTDKISFRENSGSTSYNIINNSLTSNNDASFNNVDICGNLKLNNLYVETFQTFESTQGVSSFDIPIDFTNHANSKAEIHFTWYSDPSDILPSRIQSLYFQVGDTNGTSYFPVYANLSQHYYNGNYTGYYNTGSTQEKQTSWLVMETANQDSSVAYTRGFVNFEITNDADGNDSTKHAAYSFHSVFRRRWGDNTLKLVGFGQINHGSYEINKLRIISDDANEKFYIKGKIKYF